jgi:hypothetical protein
MKRLIEPSKPEIAEYYCDLCKQLVLIDGLPQDQVPETNKRFSLAIQGDFGIISNTPGLFFNLDLCNECGEKVVKLIESSFNIKIESSKFHEEV